MPILDFPPEETPTYPPAPPGHPVLSDEILTYEPMAAGPSAVARRLLSWPPGHPGPFRYAGAAGLFSVAMAVMIAVLAASVLVAVGVAMAAEGTRLTSVQFDLERAPGDGSEGPLSAGSTPTRARYHSAVVADGGAERIVQPLTGSVSVNLSQSAASAVAADLDGLRVGPAAADFGDSLADAISSPSLGRFARIESPGSSVSLDLRYARPLHQGDYLLVQEMGGDTAIELVALGADGEPIGPARTVGPSYQWNTGHGSSTGVDFWAGVVGAPGLGEGAAIHGIRVTATVAEVKVVAMELGAAPSLPAPVAEGATGPPTGGDPLDDGAATDAASQPPFAAIGLGMGVVPAVAVDGAGCQQAVAGGGTPPEPGGSATFCFAVTNTGTVDVTDVSITDRRVGLVDAVLPRAEGPEVLAPGQQAIYYHYATPEPGAGDGSALATARPTTGLAESEVDVQPATAETALDLAQPVGESPESEMAAEQPGGDPAATETAAEPAQAGTPGPTTPPTTTPANDSEASGTDIGPQQSDPAPTALAMTGMPTEPWSIVVLAMGLIFFGYTTVTAFRRPMGAGRHRRPAAEPAGHEQLDALGFD